MDDEDSERPLEVPLRKGRPMVKKAPTSRPRDPRFDINCSGSADRRHFVRNYSFLNDVKRKELEALQQALRRETDPNQKARIKMAISRFRTSERPVKSRGKHKRLELADKFKELKQTGKLTKYLERKRKKLLKRDSKSLGGSSRHQSMP